jgi:thiamine biosynthesis lipoprotein ApbE
VTTAVVVAEDAATADALATALVANPSAGLSAAWPLHAEVLLERDGRWEMTPGLEGFLA